MSANPCFCNWPINAAGAVAGFEKALKFLKSNSVPKFFKLSPTLCNPPVIKLAAACPGLSLVNAAADVIKSAPAEGTLIPGNPGTEFCKIVLACAATAAGPPANVGINPPTPDVNIPVKFLTPMPMSANDLPPKSFKAAAYSAVAEPKLAAPENDCIRFLLPIIVPAPGKIFCA